MVKKIILLLFLLIINYTKAMQNNNKNIQILYNSNLGINVKMDFKIDNNKYCIYTNLSIPLYKIQYISNGKISNDGILNTLNFQDKRNNNIYSMANIDNINHKIIYGKPDNNISNQSINYHIYDPFSFAWQFTFNKNIFTQNIKITNGKKLYDFNALTKKQIQNLISDQTILQSKKNNPLKLNRISLNNINSINLNNFDFSLAENFYNIPIINSFNIKNIRYNLNVSKIIIDNKVVWDINN